MLLLLLANKMGFTYVHHRLCTSGASFAMRAGTATLRRLTRAAKVRTAAVGILGVGTSAVVCAWWGLSVFWHLKLPPSLDEHPSSAHAESFRVYFKPPFQFSYSNCTWQTPASVLFEPILDATIIETGLVFNSTGTYTFNKWYFDRSIETVSTRSFPSYVDEHTYISFVQIWQDKFQHLAFDTYPRASYVCNHLQKHKEVKILVVGTLQKEIFQLACPVADSRFQILDNSFSARAIYVDDYRGTDSTIVSAQGPRGNGARKDGWKRLLYPMGILPQDSIKPFGSALRGSKVVYLPRPRGARFVQNESQVIASLKKIFGDALRVYELQNDWKVDRHAFRDAKLIIGPHGGAFGNLIFAPLNAIVVEFLPLTRLKKTLQNERPCYLGLAKALGFTYHALEFDGFDFEKEMTVPIPALEALLAKIPEEDLW